MVIKGESGIVSMNAARQDLNPMVKATLPEPQFPVDVNRASQGKRLKPWPSDKGISSLPLNFIVRERLAKSEDKETNEEPNGFYYGLYTGTTGWSKGRESHDYGASIVVCGDVMSLHGEGKQVKQTSRTARYA
jgi:hypothetical protein